MTVKKWDESHARYNADAVGRLQFELGYPAAGLALHKKIMAAFRAAGVFVPTRAELEAAYKEETK